MPFLFGLIAALVAMAIAQSSKASSILPSQVGPRLLPPIQPPLCSPGLPDSVVRTMQDRNATSAELRAAAIAAGAAGYPRLQSAFNDKADSNDRAARSRSVKASRPESPSKRVRSEQDARGELKALLATLPPKEVSKIKRMFLFGQIPASVKRIGQPDRTDNDVRQAADWASAHGLPATSAALGKLVSDGTALSTPVATEPQAGSPGPPVPWKDVKVGPWTRFLRLVGVGKANEVTPANHFGIFHLGIRRLADLGVVINPRKGGDKRRWEGDWVNPSQEKFLASPVLQYQVFGKSMIDYRRRIEADPSLKSAIGKTYEGKVATLSGLLAVAHNAGLQGLKKWIANDPPRGKFRETLSAYERTTGLF